MGPIAGWAALAQRGPARRLCDRPSAPRVGRAGPRALPGVGLPAERNAIPTRGGHP